MNCHKWEVVCPTTMTFHNQQNSQRRKSWQNSSGPNDSTPRNKENHYNYLVLTWIMHRWNFVRLSIKQSMHQKRTRSWNILNLPCRYGKTFSFKVITAKIRAEDGIALCVDSTGLAVQNLESGRTAHSRFKIPIPVFENSVCAIKAESSLLKLIKESRLIIWD